MFRTNKGRSTGQLFPASARIHEHNSTTPPFPSPQQTQSLMMSVKYQGSDSAPEEGSSPMDENVPDDRQELGESMESNTFVLRCLKLAGAHELRVVEHGCIHSGRRRRSSN